MEQIKLPEQTEQKEILSKDELFLYFTRAFYVFLFTTALNGDLNAQNLFGGAYLQNRAPIKVNPIKDDRLFAELLYRIQLGEKNNLQSEFGQWSVELAGQISPSSPIMSEFFAKLHIGPKFRQTFCNYLQKGFFLAGGVGYSLPLERKIAILEGGMAFHGNNKQLEIGVFTKMTEQWENRPETNTRVTGLDTQFGLFARYSGTRAKKSKRKR